MNNTEGFNIFDDSQRIAGEDLYEIVKEIKGENLYNSLYDSRSKFAKKIARRCGYKDHLDRTDFQAFSRALLQAQAKYSSFKWNERLWGTSILDQINPAELRSLVSKQSKSQLGRLTKRGQLRRDLLIYEIAIRCGYFRNSNNRNDDSFDIKVELDQFKEELNKLLDNGIKELNKYLKYNKANKNESFQEKIPEEVNRFKKAVLEKVNDDIELSDATMERTIVSAIVKRRKRSPKFKKSVLLAHGIRCACCEINLEALIEAAHIRPVAADGNDDPSNGIPLCPNHHTAFDSSLFTIDPEDQSIILANGINYEDIGIIKKRIDLKLSRKNLEYRMSIFNPDKASTTVA